MTPLIKFMESLAASAVFTWILTDQSMWLIRTVIGNFVLFVFMAVLMYGCWLYGIICALKRLDSEKAKSYMLGEEMGRKAKW